MIRPYRSDKLRAIAKSFQDLFERMLESNGCYYFDEPGFVPEAFPKGS